MAGEAKEELFYNPRYKTNGSAELLQGWSSVVAPSVFRKAKQRSFLFEKCICFSTFTENNLISAACVSLGILIIRNDYKACNNRGSFIVGDSKSIVCNCYYEE